VYYYIFFNFTVLEESGVAKIPVVRKGGNYGSVTVKFTVTEVSATAGVNCTEKLTFLPVSKVRTNKLYIFRQCTYIIYVYVN
jgi:hypothetical protein